MAKKPRKPLLALVDTEAATSVQPPFTLGQAGRSLWDRVQSEFDCTDVAGVEMLAQICATADLAEQLAQEIERDGAVIRVRGAIRSHPAAKDLIAARSFVVRGLTRLGLNYEPLRAARGG
jgi:hypothetical protein